MYPMASGKGGVNSNFNLQQGPRLSLLLEETEEDLEAARSFIPSYYNTANMF